MTFDQRESSRDQGAPIQLYQFQYAVNGYFRYTDATEPVLYPDPGGETYEPRPVRRAKVTASGTLDRTVLRLDLPHDDPLADLFRIYPPTQQVGLVIRQGHVGETEFPLLWSGRVLSVALKGNQADLQCEPFSTALRRNGLRRRWSVGCPYVLYSTACGVIKSSFRQDGTVASTTATVLTLDPGWHGAIAPAKFAGGEVSWDAGAGVIEHRAILSVAGDALTLAGLIRDLAPSDGVAVFPGCNHQQGVADALGDCTNLFDNTTRYGGQEFISKVNPAGTRNIYY